MIGWLVIALLVTGLAIVAWGAFDIQRNFFLKATHQGNASNRQIAITFDDGPHPFYTPAVLKLLDRYNAKATFFCIGNHVSQHPKIVKQTHEAGHVVSNHSYSHAQTIDFNGKNSWIEELRQTDMMIKQATGRWPRFFRPPYGVTTPHLANAIQTSKHHVIGWCLRPYDTLKRRLPRRIAETILRKVKPGAIILLHDTHERIVPVLEQLLPELHQRGYTMVTVAELIDQDAYTEM